MATYPPRITLPYLVAKRWLEERTLAGELVQPAHTLAIELDGLDDDLRERAAALHLDIDRRGYERTGTVEVISSGVEVRTETRADGETIRMHEPIVRRVGQLPELPAIAKRPGELISAYESWRDRYRDLAPQALAAWLDAWETDDSENEDGAYPNGADFSTFTTAQFLRVNGRETWETIDAREEDLEVFQRTRAANALYHYASHSVEEGDWQFALDVVGRGAELPRWLPPAEAVTVFEDYAQRVAHVALSRAWTRQRQREGFETEMLRWARDSGSERLRMGISGGYRMVPVYLQERIASEVPGFFAHLPKDKDGVTWQPRTGPSEEALRLRRAVQGRLSATGQEGRPAPHAEIGWVKNPPQGMCDNDYRWFVDFEGEWELRRDPFEIIAVRDWLGRYVLFGAVWTTAEEQPPEYVLCRHMLRPSEYGIQGLPEPPTYEHSVARNKASGSDDDIPF